MYASYGLYLKGPIPFNAVIPTFRSHSYLLKKGLAIDTIRHELGPIAVIGELNFVSMLPKTRSGKIMRRVLKAVILDRDPGDITTIEEEGSVDEARHAWHQMKEDIARG